MGNKLGRRRQVVDEKYTKPQGLYQIKDVDHKKLKKLILESKLAPCYPGDEESGMDLEECPICFLYYPTLNRSRCCTKSICTECFLQMKSPNSARPTQCPFCKTSNYAVEYRGVKTKEEKGIEQIEEQRVIEAKIRMRRQEIQDEEQRMLKRQQLSSSTQNGEAVECDGGSVAVSSSIPPGEVEEIVSLHNSYAAPMIRNPTNTGMNRDDDFDLDLEEIMIAEAMWLSIQESERQRNQHLDNFGPNDQCVNVASGDQSVNDCVTPVTASMAGSSSPSCSGGLASAIAAAIAERQQCGGESSSRHDYYLPSFSMLPGSSRFYNTAEQEADCHHPADSSSDISSDNRTAVATDGEWDAGRDSEGAEAGSNYASYDVTEDAGSVPLTDETEGTLPRVPEPLVPQSFEEQMMLAMAVSLADTRAVSSMPGVTWQ